jgi:hypothetical protein
MSPRLLFCAGLVSASLLPGIHLYAQSTGLFVNSSNNVGIGTTNPAKLLQISGVGNLGTANEQVRVTDPTNGVTLSLLADGADGLGAIYATSPGTYKPLYIQPYGQNTIINSNGGNVGIGTTTPNQQLSVTNSFAVTNSLGAQYILMGNQDSGGVNDPTLIEAANGNLWFGHGSSWSGQGGTMTQNVTFSQGGNVGIGTSSPQWPLDINGSGARVVNGNGNAAQFDLVQTNGGHDWALASWGSSAGEGGVLNNKFSIYDNTSGGHRLVIDASGNVGIGTISPAYLLDVAGQVHAASFVSATQTYADFVFKPGYKLEPLSDVEASIKKEGHLPGIPSEEEAKAHGIDLTSMQVKLLQKIEELTLHQIDQEKRIEQLEKGNAELRERLPNE